MDVTLGTVHNLYNSKQSTIFDPPMHPLYHVEIWLRYNIVPLPICESHWNRSNAILTKLRNKIFFFFCSVFRNIICVSVGTIERIPSNDDILWNLISNIRCNSPNIKFGANIITSWLIISLNWIIQQKKKRRKRKIYL